MSHPEPQRLVDVISGSNTFLEVHDRLQEHGYELNIAGVDDTVRTSFRKGEGKPGTRCDWYAESWGDSGKSDDEI